MLLCPPSSSHDRISGVWPPVHIYELPGTLTMQLPFKIFGNKGDNGFRLVPSVCGGVSFLLSAGRGTFKVWQNINTADILKGSEQMPAWLAFSPLERRILVKEVDSGGENTKGSMSQHSEILRFRAFPNAGFAFSFLKQKLLANAIILMMVWRRSLLSHHKNGTHVQDGVKWWKDEWTSMVRQG